MKNFFTISKFTSLILLFHFCLKDVVLSLSVSTNNSEPETDEVIPDYNGYRLYRLKVETKPQLESLLKLENQGELDFWQIPRLDSFAEVLVSKVQQPEFIHMMNETYTEYTTVTVTNWTTMLYPKENEKRTKDPKEMSWDEYHTIDTIYSWLDALEADYPHLAKVEVIGNSTEGTPLKLIKISSADGYSKPGVFIDGTYHAREWISPAVATYIINELVTKSAGYEHLLSQYDFYILPIVNPDGYKYTMSYNRLWRKSRVPGPRDTIGGLIGCRGVDLNRNFGYKFGGDGSSSSPCSLTYRGPKAFSEPESAAIRDFVFSNPKDWRFYLSLHSFGQKWLTPWAYTAELPDDFEELKRVGEIGAAAIYNVSGTHYRVGTNNDLLYLAAGGSDDWFKGAAGFKYAYTLELPDTGFFGFLLPSWRIMPTCEETWVGIQAALMAIV